MSDTENPYKSPEAPVAQTPVEEGKLTSKMLQYLNDAAPWTKFMGVLGYILTGFMALGAIGVFIGGSVAPQALGFAAFAAPTAVTSLIVGALTFFLARFSFRVGKQIRAYSGSGRPEDLEEAFRNNRTLWKLIGILSVVLLAITVLGMILPGALL